VQTYERTTAVAREQLYGNVFSATRKYAIVKETFSVRSVSGLYNEDSDAARQHTARAAASAALSCTGLPRHSGRNECPPPLRQKQQVSSQSVQAPKANSSSLNDMFTVVATIIQQIMTELNGAESEESRIIAITKIVLKFKKKMTARIHRLEI
jgi:hypothetical protein